MNRNIRNTLAAAAIVVGAASAAQAQFVITPISLSGEPAPGMGANYDNFDRPNLSEGGAVLKMGDTDGVTTADDFVIVDNTLIAREGDAAPGVPAGGLLGPFGLADNSQQINAAGNVIFESDLTVTPTTEDLTLYKAVGGVMTVVAREGTTAAGIPDRLHGAFSFAGIFNDNNHGYLADLGGTSTTDDSVIYRGDTPIYREGTAATPLPGTLWDANFAEVTWNGAGHLLFLGNTNAATMDQILVRDVNGAATIVAREGDVIAANGGPDTISLFLQAQLAENGKWAFRGNLDVAPATSDSFILTENGFYRQEGEAVPELGAGVVTGNLNGLDMNSNGDVFSLADIIGAADPNVDEGLFFNDTLVITDGVQAPGLPAGTLLMDLGFENMFINDAGQMIFEATFGDGTTTTGEGIFSVVVPEPTSLAVTGIGALALLSRRRRRSA
jgi:hypothetical protein